MTMTIWSLKSMPFHLSIGHVRKLPGTFCPYCLSSQQLARHAHDHDNLEPEIHALSFINRARKKAFGTLLT